ncbi:GNAT family N-acetyltransferase [Streptomyces sp. NPDC050523]|uniref:GNAT family N-acetyltransferase n=1 Tax=Streptomyces sp. NPDC050523 TaxID=3365622 RepID=UPI00378E08BE
MTTPQSTAGIRPVLEDNHGPSDATHRAVAGAVAQAEAAAEAAGVQVRGVSRRQELDAVHDLFNFIWQPDPTSPLMTGELLRALVKSGNYVGGAFDGDELVGACVGFWGAPADESVHSHIAGVSNAARGRSVGFALKLHQRAWSLQRGATVISWTYDPLVRRNAYFNLVKLAAQPAEYLPDFYGGVHDRINAGDDTDRLLVNWRLDHEPVRAACTGEARPADARAARLAGASVALDRSGEEAPVLGALDAPCLLVAVPSDIERLRLTSAGLAKDWRSALRDVLGTLMAEGARITGFDRGGWYVLQRPAPSGADAVDAGAPHASTAEEKR